MRSIFVIITTVMIASTAAAGPDIQFLRGPCTRLPASAAVGEPIWCTDTKELYIGNGPGNPLTKVNRDGGTPPFTLLPATASILGGIKVGAGLAITLDGTLSNTGIAGVASFNGRGGAVTPQPGDYSVAMITGLSPVASSGSYIDLINKPTQVNSDWNATSGAAQIFNKPIIPTLLSQLGSDTTHRTVTDAQINAWNSNASPVTSVFGRTGAITKQPGDYTAVDVGADPLGSATSVQGNLDTHAAQTTSAHGGIVSSSDPRLTNARPASDVYAWAKATTKPSYTATEVGADASGAATAQVATHEGIYNHVDLPTDAQKAALVGTGTPGSGNKYVTQDTLVSGLAGKADASSLGTAATQNIGTTAGTVAAGDDSRFSDTRPASDVYAWAKAATKPTYTASNVGALPATSASVCVSRSGTLIRTAWKYTENQDMWLDFVPFGPNNITMFSQWWLKPNQGPIYSDDLATGATSLDTSATDWNDGPYTFQASGRTAAATYLGDLTGGNHGLINHGGSGTANSPTARQVSIAVTVDGNALSSGIACGQRADITVVNNVQADNTVARGSNPGQGPGTDYSDDTGAEILQEIVHYAITGDGNVFTDTTATALEGLYIRVWYGPMGSRRTGIWDGTLFWNNASSLVPVSYTSGLTTNAGTYSSYPNVWQYSIRGTNHDQIGWIDTSYGLGTGSNIAASSNRAFTTSANKTYFYMVSGSANTATLTTGQSVSWRGGYKFIPHTALNNPQDIIPASALPASYYLPTTTDQSAWNAKQAALVSGTNIKTVAGVSLLGPGDIGAIGDSYISSAETWNAKQAAITTGTTAQYFKGDLSLGTLNQAAVAGLTTSDTPTFKQVNTISSTQYVQGPTAVYAYADNNPVTFNMSKAGKSGGTNLDAIPSGAFIAQLNMKGLTSGSTYTITAQIQATAAENFSSSSAGGNLAFSIVPYGVSSVSLSKALVLSKASTTDTTISLGDQSGGTATLQTTSHATKGLLTIPNAVSVTGNISASGQIISTGDSFNGYSYTFTGTNTTGSSLAAHILVALDTGGARKITTAATSATNVIGVLVDATANSATGRVATQGAAIIVNDATACSIGNYAYVSSTVAGTIHCTTSAPASVADLNTFVGLVSTAGTASTSVEVILRR